MKRCPKCLQPIVPCDCGHDEAYYQREMREAEIAHGYNDPLRHVSSLWEDPVHECSGTRRWQAMTAKRGGN